MSQDSVFTVILSSDEEGGDNELMVEELFRDMKKEIRECKCRKKCEVEWEKVRDRKQKEFDLAWEKIRERERALAEGIIAVNKIIAAVNNTE